MNKLPPYLPLAPGTVRYLTPLNIKKEAEPFEIKLGTNEARCLGCINIVRSDMHIAHRHDGLWVVVESAQLLRFVLSDFCWTPTEFHRFDSDERG